MKSFYIAINIEGKVQNITCVGAFVDFTGLYIFNKHKGLFITVSSPTESGREKTNRWSYED